jgi:hypothetical protein
LPKRGVAREDCWFYHTVDVPGHGTVVGQWDLRAGVDDYLGQIDFQGKRVLEMGTASGFLCFSMEKRGADVVAFDLAPKADWDIVPLSRCPDLSPLLDHKLALLDRMRNGYWLCHEAFKSRARVVYGTVYDVPASIGPVDVCTFCSILLHLRDPFLALANGLRLTRETVVVSEVLPDFVEAKAPVEPVETKPPFWRRVRRKVGSLVAGHPCQPTFASRLPLLALLPDEHRVDCMDSWWALSPRIVQQFLAILGFEASRVTFHQQPYQGQSCTMFTVVAQRTQPMPRRLDGPFPWF